MFGRLGHRPHFLPAALGLALGLGAERASAEGGEAPATPEPAAAEPEGPVAELPQEQGLAFHPLTPQAGDWRLALGMQFDAVDPQTVYGMEPRVPQLTLDYKLGLGKGWFALGHVNTFVVSNEILAGAGHRWTDGRWSLGLAAFAGVSLGFLTAFGFDAVYLAPQLRPEVSVGLEADKVFFSLTGNLILGYPQTATVGEVSGTLEVPGPLTGASVRLVVENPIPRAGVWYFGAALLYTRAFYQMWLLFPDTPTYTTYPRLVAGYEF